MRVSRPARYAALLLLLLLAGCKTELYAGLPEREANEMLGILLAQGVAAEKATAKDGTIIYRLRKISLLKPSAYWVSAATRNNASRTWAKCSSRPG